MIPYAVETRGRVQRTEPVVASTTSVGPPNGVYAAIDDPRRVARSPPRTVTRTCGADARCRGRARTQSTSGRQALPGSRPRTRLRVPRRSCRRLRSRSAMTTCRSDDRGPAARTSTARQSSAPQARTVRASAATRSAPAGTDHRMRPLRTSRAMSSGNGSCVVARTSTAPRSGVASTECSDVSSDTSDRAQRTAPDSGSSATTRVSPDWYSRSSLKQRRRSAIRSPRSMTAGARPRPAASECWATFLPVPVSRTTKVDRSSIVSTVRSGAAIADASACGQSRGGDCPRDQKENDGDDVRARPSPTSRWLTVPSALGLTRPVPAHSP